VIAIIDYRAGNLASVKKAFDYLGYESVVADDPNQIARAGKIVLPGVGNFEATTALSGALQQAVVEAIEQKVPLLGICLGMQWMFESSHEAPQLRGLGLFAAVFYYLWHIPLPGPPPLPQASVLYDANGRELGLKRILLAMLGLAGVGE